MSSTEEVFWFPMRVTYQREMQMKLQLDCLHIESFIPMHYKMVETSKGKKRKLVPAIHNLIFVHSTQVRLTELKLTKKELHPLRYMTRKAKNGNLEIIHVPDQQMENFMKVASVNDDSVFYLNPSEFINKIGKKVRITTGPFKDVEGVVKRIKKNKSVVVQIEGIAAMAIAFVPTNYLLFI